MRWPHAVSTFVVALALASCGDDGQEEPRTEVSPVVEVALGVTSEDEHFTAMGQSVAATENGEIAVSWRRRTNSDFAAAVVQVLDWQGVPRLAPGGVVVESGEVGEPSIVARGGGGFFVAYQRAAGPGHEIVVHRFGGDGSVFWPGGVAAARFERGAEAQAEPFLTADTAGGVYVCFAVLDWSGTRSPHNLRCQHLSAGGQRLWGETGRQVAPARGWRVLPRAVLDGSGGLLVFWADYGDVYDSLSVPIRMEAQRFSPAGNTLWSPEGLLVRETNLAETNGHSYRFYDVVPDGAGGAILAFNDWTQTADAHMDVLAQRVSQDGRLLWGSGAVVAARPGHEQHDATMATCPGCAAVTVISEAFDNPLMLYMLGPDGQHLWPAAGVELSSGSGSSYSAQGDFSDGILRVAWTRQRGAESSDFDIERARFDIDGTRLAGSEDFSTAPEAQFAADAAFQKLTSSFVVAWSDTRASGSSASGDAYVGIQVDRLRLAGRASGVSAQVSSAPRLLGWDRHGALLVESEHEPPAQARRAGFSRARCSLPAPATRR